LFFEVNLHDPPIAETARREEARLEILLWRKKQARRIFQERTDVWAARIGVKYRRLTPSNPRRQWGSCSAQNDIRINWRLVMAPPDLLDYVIVHELCHVTHKNHSKRFWNFVAVAMPDWKIRRKALHRLDPGTSF
jgi:predicted metal-dependent hydrolase